MDISFSIYHMYPIENYLLINEETLGLWYACIERSFNYQVKIYVFVMYSFD